MIFGRTFMTLNPSFADFDSKLTCDLEPTNLCAICRIFELVYLQTKFAIASQTPCVYSSKWKYGRGLIHLANKSITNVNKLVKDNLHEQNKTKTKKPTNKQTKSNKTKNRIIHRAKNELKCDYERLVCEECTLWVMITYSYCFSLQETKDLLINNYAQKSDFPSYLTPLLLAAKFNQYSIIKVWISILL